MAMNAPGLRERTEDAAFIPIPSLPRQRIDRASTELVGRRGGVRSAGKWKGSFRASGERVARGDNGRNTGGRRATRARETQFRRKRKTLRREAHSG